MFKEQSDVDFVRQCGDQREGWLGLVSNSRRRIFGEEKASGRCCRDENGITSESLFNRAYFLMFYTPVSAS